MKKLISIGLMSILMCSTLTLCMGQTATPQDNKKKSVPASDQQMQSKQQPVKTEKVVYTCPMHPAVSSDKPGKCPDCKMNLVQKDNAVTVYTCSMHPEVVKDQPGKCPKCKMNLVKKDNKKDNTDKKM